MTRTRCSPPNCMALKLRCSREVMPPIQAGILPERTEKVGQDFMRARITGSSVRSRAVHNNIKKRASPSNTTRPSCAQTFDHAYSGYKVIRKRHGASALGCFFDVAVIFNIPRHSSYCLPIPRDGEQPSSVCRILDNPCTIRHGRNHTCCKAKCGASSPSIQARHSCSGLNEREHKDGCC